MTVGNAPRAEVAAPSFGAFNTENVQHGALWHAGARTSCNGLRREPFKLSEIGHFCLDVLEVVSRNLFDFGA
jgi:hypothetical protein